MVESSEDRLKRFKMRSWRRGTKEMDMVLGPFSDTELETLNDAELDQYDALLSENDHDLYQWVTGQVATPAPYLGLLTRIANHAFDSKGN